ncbi:GNAT family N-acetyltransferase [Candidatus Enterococcus huntleyi]|uniref:GNAT family N-acetyltransferase n=1 Tax=Candidatus Enterococcus huntleyi TaxID=1857217 RepID=UPI00192A4B90|nr:GNAT family N-acetyltransferase [Enterococcus sp. JM4C]
MIQVKELTKEHLDACVDLAMATFTKEPWNDVYESREQALTFYQNHLYNNYFLGYIAVIEEKIVALSIGMKKPWIQGMEYYIDEFCVDYNRQGQGIGTIFINEIIKDLEKKNLNAIILNTEKNYPSTDFYLKNGFTIQKELIVLTR